MMKSLKHRIILIALAAVFLGGSASTFIGGFVFSKEYGAVLLSEAVSGAQELRQKMERLLGFDIPVEDLIGFDEQIEELIARYDHLSHAMVVTPEGAILFHSRPETRHERLEDENLLGLVQRGENDITSAVYEGVEITSSVIPVFDGYGRHVASIIVGFPADVVKGKLRRLALFSSSSGLFFIVVSFFIFLLLLSRWVTNPLGRLMLAVREIEKDPSDLKRRVPVTADNEIGQLGTAFNVMLERLKESDEKVKRYTQKLEEKVGVRTVALQIANERLTRDNTKRREAERSLRESERKYRTLFDNAADAIYIHGLDGRFLGVNNVAEQMMGYSKEEFLAMTPRNLVAPERRHLVPERFDEITKHSYETVHIRKDKKPIAVEINSKAIEYEGRPALLAVVRDISKRVETEKMLKEKEKQLQQAQKMEAVGKLAGGVAHDFNNILTGIIGYADLLKEGDALDSGRLDMVDEIHKAADRAAALTHQLLAFSRKQVLQLKTINLNVLIADLEGMLKRIIGEDVDLLTVMEPRLGLVRADPGQVEQVIMNLCVNARDAMPDGGRITIETKNELLDETYCEKHSYVKPGGYVCIAVSDNGHGMDTGTKNRIFEPFFTTKGTGKGTGLGLSTVFGIVKQSGGHVTVYSEVGQGSVFKIYLPRTDEQLVKEVERGSVTIAGGKETVLVVEDDEIVRKTAAAILSGYGYNILEAESGEKALRIGETKVDLVLTDVVMPGMNGRELSEKLIDRFPGMRVLFMSGYTDDAIIRHGVLEKGMPFIQKPFSSRGIARKVREVMDAKRV
ncbi:MAG: PAS domain S-box protein [Spirochaetes bacterium]|nr:PAS domain S-box protein [Spirochaetota bacterium]